MRISFHFFGYIYIYNFFFNMGEGGSYCYDMIPVSGFFPVNSCRKSWYSLVPEICSLWNEYMSMVVKKDMSSSKRPIRSFLHSQQAIHQTYPMCSGATPWVLLWRCAKIHDLPPGPGFPTGTHRMQIYISLVERKSYYILKGPLNYFIGCHL